jgi:hypothetical protein
MSLLFLFIFVAVMILSVAMMSLPVVARFHPPFSVWFSWVSLLHRGAQIRSADSDKGVVRLGLDLGVWISFIVIDDFFVVFRFLG